MLLLVFAQGSGATSYPANSASFTVEVWAEVRTYIAKRNVPATYHFYANLDVPLGGPLIMADVYFGLSTPGNESVFTWTRTSAGAGLVRGMSPAIQGVNLNKAASIDVMRELGGALTYQFSGGEKPGMYTVFALMVAAGADPVDPANWFAVRMEPLVVQ